MQTWHVMYTKPHREELVDSLLEERGIETYYPYLKVERGYGRGVRYEPFFPNYLFFLADLASPGAQGLQWLPGVRRIVYVGDRPAQVPHSVVDALRERLAPYHQRSLRRSEILYQRGQKVVVTGGPFAGLDGIFQKGVNGRDRVQVLLDMVGKWTRAEIGADQIKPREQWQGVRF